MVPLLDIQDIQVAYGRHVPVVEGGNFQVKEQGTTAILGANGAGKSTVLKAVTGLLSPHAGRILFRGDDITSWSVRKRVSSGITYVPEGREIVYSLSVKENLLLGGYQIPRRERRRRMEMVMGIFPEISAYLNSDSWRLSGGEQQMLAIGRALMSGPHLLLMDEPSLGLAPILVKRVFRRLEELSRESELSILLVEQNFHLALRLVDYVYFMRNGRIIDEGTVDRFRAEENADHVISSYLGG